MSQLTYDENNLQYAGEFRISEIAIFNVYGNVAGIATASAELSIYEDIEQNFITGNLTFVDTEDLVNKLPILGQEYLEFKVRTPLKSTYGEGEYDFTNTRMAVYKCTKERLNSNTQQVSLDFISTEAIKDSNTKISRAFDGPYDDAVAKTFKNTWGLNSKKKFYVQPTQGNFKFVAPNTRPTDLMNMIASRAVPKTSIAPGYFFYENGQGFHFRSIDSFFFMAKSEGLAPHPEMFEYFADSETARGLNNPRDNPMSQMRTVKSFKVLPQNDLITGQRTGTYASKLITHDQYNKTFKEHEYNYIDDYIRTPHLEKDDAMTDQAEYRGFIPQAHYDFNDTETTNTRSQGSAYKYLSDYSDARIMVQSNTANIHNSNMKEGYKVSEYVQRRKNILGTMNALQCELETHGNTHLNIGHIIRINVPRAGRNKFGIKSADHDKYLTGRWLITAIRHSFNIADQIHTMALTCIKETYKTPLYEKASPLQISVKDEGKPVNLYDDSQYD
ncbi:MAG: hypothetical protein CMK29_01905 [Porticoccaceae bacterium]|nr:hypothetical protein [Porticoccaceae bacterium]OUW59159.1 MAG: hypothetical protein CBD57_01215 [Candidatus Pelagibacter sp. TMED197]